MNQETHGKHWKLDTSSVELPVRNTISGHTMVICN